MVVVVVCVRAGKQPAELAKMRSSSAFIHEHAVVPPPRHGPVVNGWGGAGSAMCRAVALGGALAGLLYVAAPAAKAPGGGGAGAARGGDGFTPAVVAGGGAGDGGGSGAAAGICAGGAIGLLAFVVMRSAR